MNVEWQWQQENAKLRKENAELHKALGFYADKHNYGFSGFNGVRRIVKIETDGGEMARKTLEGLGNGFNKIVCDTESAGRKNI